MFRATDELLVRAELPLSRPADGRPKLHINTATVSFSFHSPIAPGRMDTDFNLRSSAKRHHITPMK